MRARSLIMAVSALAAAFLPASVVAQPAKERVWVVYQPGAKGAAQRALHAANAQFHHQFDELNAFAVTLPAPAIEGISRNPAVEYVEEDPAREMYSALPGETPPYGIGMVQASTMHALGYTGAGRSVCVIDSGLKVHPNVPAPGSSITYVPGNLPPDQDGDGHGTHVAGTVAAASHNGNVGVAPGARLVIVRVFGDDGVWAYSSTLIDGAFKCRDNGANIISMSLGGGRKSRTEETGFKGLDAGGMLSIAAAGNAGDRTTSYPAGYASVVSVAAVDSAMQHASFSQVNRDVELSAPGVAVWSTVPWIAIASVTVGASIFEANPLEGSPLSAGTLGNLVEGGLCDATSAAFAGKVVHCLRGTISFADKVANAAAGGAIAVVISNNVPGNFLGTLGEYVSTIPAVSVSQADGVALTSSAGQAATVVNSLDPNSTGYEPWDGTSMATPHVSGAAALVWGACPLASANSVRAAVNSSALDLGSAGRDTSFGFGLVQACAAARQLCGACP